jgi:hypothetical protein
MAHIYMQFDFASDEAKAQSARHKLEVWKQAFRLDKKLLYKFERSDESATRQESEGERPESSRGKNDAKLKSASKASKEGESKEPGNVRLLVRLGFSGHEKLSEHRWAERIPTEDPFASAASVTVKPGDTQFADFEKRFDNLE